MDTKELIKILDAVPETNLRLIQLVGEIIDDKGDIDPDKVILHRKELEEATDQADAYIAATREAITCLQEMAP